MVHREVVGLMNGELVMGGILEGDCKDRMADRLLRSYRIDFFRIDFFKCNGVIFLLYKQASKHSTTDYIRSYCSALSFKFRSLLLNIFLHSSEQCVINFDFNEQIGFCHSAACTVVVFFFHDIVKGVKKYVIVLS